MVSAIEWNYDEKLVRGRLGSIAAGLAWNKPVKIEIQAWSLPDVLGADVIDDIVYPEFFKD